jgi:DNA-binding NarL/FixJ family response regulator
MIFHRGSTKSKIITIVLVESQQIVRTGIRLVLERFPNFRVTGEAGCGEQAVETIKTRQPNILICGIHIQKMDGPDLIYRARKVSPETRSVILSDRDDYMFLFESILAGAYGYLLENITPDELGKALKRINKGEIVFPDGLANISSLWDTLWDPKKKNRLLSSREMEILALAASGLTNKEISLKLGLSVRTVEKHFEFILDKLAVSSRTQAIQSVFYEHGCESSVQKLNININPNAMQNGG